MEQPGRQPLRKKPRPRKVVAAIAAVVVVVDSDVGHGQGGLLQVHDEAALYPKMSHINTPFINVYLVRHLSINIYVGSFEGALPH